MSGTGGRRTVEIDDERVYRRLKELARADRRTLKAYVNLLVERHCREVGDDASVSTGVQAGAGGGGRGSVAPDAGAGAARRSSGEGLGGGRDLGVSPVVSQTRPDRPSVEELRALVNAVKPHAGLRTAADLLRDQQREREAQARRERLRTHPEEESQDPTDYLEVDSGTETDDDSGSGASF